MKSKKILIIVLIIVAILLLVLGGGAFAYFKTDIFKTDEQLFYKYMGQVVEKIQNFESEKVSNYFQKLETTPYENNGKLTVNVTMPEEIGVDLSKVNNLNITFSGKTDKVNDIKEQNIQLNYTDDISFPLEYRKVGNMAGITSELIIKKYLAVDLDRLDDLLSKLGITVEGIDELSKLEERISTEEIKAELEKCKQVLLNNVKETNFSKIDDNSFALTLNEQEILTIMQAILGELKTSSLIPEENKNQIDALLENLDITNATTDTFIQIVVNKQGTVKLIIEDAPEITIQTTPNGLIINLVADEEKITIEMSKAENENKIMYNVGAKIESASESEEDSEVTGNINFSATYANLNASNASEQYKFSILFENQEEDDIQEIGYDYTLDTTKTFVDTVEVADLNSNTAVILNDCDAQYLQDLVTIIQSQFAKVYTNQMQSLGVTNGDNPLIYATPIGLYAMFTANMTNQMINNAQQITTEQEIEAFNVVFTNYQGAQTGVYTKALISRVIANNSSNPNKIVTINGSSDETALTNLISQIDVAKTYTIVCNINEITGLVNSINIYG